MVRNLFSGLSAGTLVTILRVGNSPSWHVDMGDWRASAAGIEGYYLAAAPWSDLDDSLSLSLRCYFWMLRLSRGVGELGAARSPL